MIAGECSSNSQDLARISRLVCQTQAHVRQVSGLFNRVHENLAALGGGEQDAEAGWRPGR
jgi:hypothetical protein